MIAALHPVVLNETKTNARQQEPRTPTTYRAQKNEREVWMFCCIIDCIFSPILRKVRTFVIEIQLKEWKCFVQPKSHTYTSSYMI